VARPARLTLLALLVALAPSAAAEVHLVAIGNNTGLSGEVQLRYAEDDAVGFATVMQQLGDVSGERATTLLGRDAAAVRAALLKANTRLRDASAGSVLVVYYSGHADARGLHLGPGATLPYDELRGLVEASPAAMRLLVIDSCRSGGATRVKGITPAPLFELTRPEGAAPPEGLAIITSSAAGEDSHESDRLRSSFFSHHLFTGLRGAADADRDDRVSLSEAYDYAYQQTLRSSGQTTQLQHPTYAWDMKGRSELVLTWLSSRRGGGRLTLGTPGTYLVMEGGEAGPVVAELVVPTGGATLVLPARRYLVQRREASAYHEYEITVGRGQASSLPREPDRTVAYARLLRKGAGDRSLVHGLYALGGVRGAIVDGQGVGGQAIVGYGADLSWMTLGLRVRLGVPQRYDVDADTAISQTEVGVGLTAVRYVDVEGVSVGLGLLFEAGWLAQSFETTGSAPDRTAFLAGVGALFSVEIDLTPAIALHVEGGPITQVYRRAVVEAGAAVDSELTSPLTGWLAAGIIGRL